MRELEAFLTRSDTKAFDRNHRQRINFNIGRYNQSVKTGKLQYEDIELARDRAAYTKRKVVEHLEEYLVEWEGNFMKRGGKVIWAEDADEAMREITTILKRHAVKMVVKSKSMVTEEIGLTHRLQEEKIEAWETDLGEYIQQLSKEPPYHIVTPAMHKSKEDVAELFHKELGTPEGSTPEELTLEARRQLREKYQTAGAGITGANFLLADIGGVSITENEGNARLCAALPKVHIVVAGIEKLLPSVNDLPLFLPLLSTFGTGQQVTNYNSIFTGPRRKGEQDGPEQMYVVLLDNGRSNLLAQPQQRQALSCIRCGACLNACPVYKNIGGHSYARTYSGPIGSVISPFFGEYNDSIHMSYASTLCGNCTEVCPVRIDIHGLLLKNRHRYVENYDPATSERITWFLWKKGMLSRKLMNMGNGSVKGLMVNTLFKRSWGNRRKLPQFSKKSFNELWKEKQAAEAKQPKTGNRLRE